MDGISILDFNRAARLACRHYVNISYYARSPEIMAARKSVAYPCVCSAFVMRVRQIWCLVTAGHIFDGIDAERGKGIELVNFRLWDGWSVGAKHRDYIPFDFDEPPKVRLNRDGLDYGLIPLREFYVNALAANGVEPITEEHYEKDWPADFHTYAMIGTPGQTVSLARQGDRDTKFSQSVMVIRLEREYDPPEELIAPFDRFYGRILMPEDSPEWHVIGKDIRGMSGGPVIAIRHDDERLRYWVIAVQSGWLPSRRIVAACYFQAFARFAAEMIDRCESPT